MDTLFFPGRPISKRSLEKNHFVTFRQGKYCQTLQRGTQPDSIYLLLLWQPSISLKKMLAFLTPQPWKLGLMFLSPTHNPECADIQHGCCGRQPLRVPAACGNCVLLRCSSACFLVVEKRNATPCQLKAKGNLGVRSHQGSPDHLSALLHSASYLISSSISCVGAQMLTHSSRFTSSQLNHPPTT